MRNGGRRRQPSNWNGVGRIGWAGMAALIVLLPGLAGAQEIGGTVTDTTAGVLPGVTVEARSPTLIEQVRTAVTDGSGQYLIVALEPGTYTVTYSLPGFTTFVREGIEITSGFTANIDVQMSVGDIQESITVSGATPVVDIQNVEQVAVIDREIIDSIPTGKSINSYGLLIPGMVGENSFGSSLTQDAGGLTLQTLGTMSIHGGSQSDQMMTLNGMDVGDTFLQGVARAYFPDTAFEEMSFSYSGNSAEIETGGVSIGMIPREGSNSFSGSFFTTFSFPDLLANNLDQDLMDQGLLTGTALDETWTFAPAFGGPIVRDRVWFFFTQSSQKASLQSPGVFFSVDPSSFFFDPDTSRPSNDTTDAYEQSLNLTFQLSEKDKLKAYWTNSASNNPYRLQGRALGSLFLQPDAAFAAKTRTNVYQLAWTRPQTNRLLFEAGVSHLPTGSLNAPTDVADTTVPGILEVSPLTGLRNASSFLGQTTRNSPKRVEFYRGSVSYVTGSHNLKVGFTFQQQGTFVQTAHGGGWQRFFTFRGAPYRATFYMQQDQTDKANSLGIYAQEQWTLDRLTVNAGLRWDYFDTYYPTQERPTNIWVTAPFTVEGQTIATWKDFQPRIGLAYDLRGDGRTALKFSVNRYGKRNSTELSRAINPGGSNRQMNRSWFDGATSHAFGRNLPSCIGPVACVAGDGIVQGDPTNPLPNGEIVSPNTTPGFGVPVVTTFFDPEWSFGWGKRYSNWEVTGSIQQELFPGVSLDVGYFRRIWVNHNVVDNRALGTADFDVATVTVPTDSRLPDGGGGTISFYDLNPGSVRLPDDVTTSANNFGGESQTWDGIDVTLDARIENVLLQGGLSTGRASNDSCGLLSQVPESAPTGSATGDADTATIEHCSRTQNWLTQLKLMGSYTLPYDIQLAATLQNQPGPERAALAQFTAADTNLGRPLVLYPSAVQLNILEPGTFYGERFNQLDFRVTKIFNLGGTARFRAMFDLFNVLNANAVTIEDPTFGPTWLAPTAIMPGRLAKFAFQIDF